MSTATLWRLEELVKQSQLLAELVPEGDSKRVRWSPNERLVRYYTTLGLLDRPAEMRGRTAFYALRHLLQLLAVKTLQSQGATLQECQLQLAGLPDERLAQISSLPDDWRERVAAPVAPTRPDSGRFWERVPAPVPASETFSLVGLELAPGVQLTIDAARYPGLDPAAIRRAARSLCEYIMGGQHEPDPQPARE